MKQLTIRGFDEELATAIKRIAREQQVSLNQAVLQLLRRGAGLGAGGSDAIGDRLDDLIGSWTNEDSRAFDEAVADFEQIDEAMWR